MRLIKKPDEKTRLQRIENKKTKNLHAKFKRETIFTSYKPWNAIFVMVAPTIISVVIFSTYQIFDKWIATQWGGGNIIARYGHITDISPTEALKIINIATTYAAVPSSIAVAFSLLVSIGTSVKFSIAYGKNKGDKMAGYLGNGFLTSFITSIIFMIAMYFIIPSIIEFQAGTANVNNPAIRNIIIDEATRFSRILILGSPLLFFSNFWLNLLRSEGRVISNIIIIVTSCVINIMLDFVFVIPGNLGMEGTAYATIISWFLIFGMSIGLIYYTGSSLKFQLRHLKLKKSLVIGILIIGLSSLLESAAQSLLAMITTKILNTLPPPIDYPNAGSEIPVYVQLYGGIMPWLILINAPVIGVSQGARSLVGYVYGTRNYYRVWQIMWRLIVLILILLCLSLLLVVVAGQYMMNAFGVDLAMANHFKSYIIMQFAFYPLATLHFVAIIFYQGINRGKIALFASLQRTIVMPALSLGLGYLIAMQTANGFFFYMMVGFIDLFAAFILLPLLIHTFIKARPYIKRSHEDQIPEVEVREVETLNLKQK